MTITETPEPRRRDGKSKFLALLPIIKEEVEAGFTLRAIYDKHLDLSGISYSQFARYVGRYVRDDDKPTEPEETRPGINAETPDQAGRSGTPAPAPAPVERSEPSARPRPATGIGARFQLSAKPDDDDKLI